MNALTSASFPHGLPEMGSEASARANRNEMLSIIQAGVKAAVECDPRGMSDDQLGNERFARGALSAAIHTMREAIKTVNRCSTVVQICPTTFENFVHDELSFAWDEKISAARNG